MYINIVLIYIYVVYDKGLTITCVQLANVPL